jgi:hypothetical protein
MELISQAGALRVDGIDLDPVMIGLAKRRLGTRAPGSVDVSVDSGTLTTKAQRSIRTEETVDWIVSERFTGTNRGPG